MKNKIKCFSKLIFMKNFLNYCEKVNFFEIKPFSLSLIFSLITELENKRALICSKRDMLVPFDLTQKIHTNLFFSKDFNIFEILETDFYFIFIFDLELNNFEIEALKQNSNQVFVFQKNNKNQKKIQKIGENKIKFKENIFVFENFEVKTI